MDAQHNRNEMNDSNVVKLMDYQQQSEECVEVTMPEGQDVPRVKVAGNIESRVVNIEGRPWFYLDDVRVPLLREKLEAAAECQDWPGPFSAIESLDGDELIEAAVRTDAGVSRRTVISESGLYKLMLTGSEVEAVHFQQWVVRVVLPILRKMDCFYLDVGDDAPLPVGVGQAADLRAELEWRESMAQLVALSEAVIPASGTGLQVPKTRDDAVTAYAEELLAHHETRQENQRLRAELEALRGRDAS